MMGVGGGERGRVRQGVEWVGKAGFEGGAEVGLGCNEV